MRLLILSFYFSPDLSAGSFRTAALVEQLLEQSNEQVVLDVITTLPNRYKTFDVDAKTLETYGRVNIHRIPIPNHRSGMIDQSRAFLSYFLKVIKLTRGVEYKLVYATSSRLFTATLGALVARIKSCRLYLDIRDIFVDTICNVLSPGVVRIAYPLLSMVERWTFQKADKVNLVSKGFESYFLERYQNRSYSFHTNGVDREFIECCTIPCKDKNAERHSISILYAGNIGEGQGLHKIVPDLAKLLSGKATFKIIGDGGRRSELERTIATSKLENVEIFAPLDRKKLIAAYQDADILFLHLGDLPAFEKVLPSKIFEYAATGKPVLAGVGGFAAKFICNEVSNAVVFPPCNAEMAMNVLEKLDLSVVSREQFVQKYSRNMIMKRMAFDVLSTCEERLR